MHTLYATRDAAINESSKARCKPAFRVEIVFDDADDPQVIAEGVGAALAMDAARTYASATDPMNASDLFGVRGDDGKPSDKEKVLRRMLNGGSLVIDMGRVKILGTFMGYMPAR